MPNIDGSTPVTTKDISNDWARNPCRVKFIENDAA